MLLLWLVRSGNATLGLGPNCEVRHSRCIRVGARCARGALRDSGDRARCPRRCRARSGSAAAHLRSSWAAARSLRVGAGDAGRTRSGPGTTLTLAVQSWLRMGRWLYTSSVAGTWRHRLARSHSRLRGTLACTRRLRPRSLPRAAFRTQRLGRDGRLSGDSAGLHGTCGCARARRQPPIECRPSLRARRRACNRSRLAPRHRSTCCRQGLGVPAASNRTHWPGANGNYGDPPFPRFADRHPHGSVERARRRLNRLHRLDDCHLRERRRPLRQRARQRLPQKWRA